MSSQSPAASSQGDQPANGSFPLNHAPRLGEFSHLIERAKSLFGVDVIPEPSSVTRQRDSQSNIEKSPLKIGDFDKVLERFLPSKLSADSLDHVDSTLLGLAIQPSDSLPCLAGFHSLPCRIRRSRARRRLKWPSEAPSFHHPEMSDHIAADLSSQEPDITSESDQCFYETRRSIVTPASTPPTPQPQFSFSEPRKRASENRDLWSPATKKASHIESKDQASVLFSYNTGKGCLPVPVHGRVLSSAQKHGILELRLSLHRAVDATIAQQFPSISANGTHVFIDMSNIEINFLQALKAKHSLSDRAYPMPGTHIDLGLLTEILLRGRFAVTQIVGGSVVPGRTKPWYVAEFRRLGYHVDLRQRKPVQDSSTAASSSSTAAPLYIRYVEDLVDETLQTRIAESVMEYFDQQGTIVLATGDAKPAEYSDGFFTYVERALRMGWNVELASWKSSLSSTWTNPRWKSQWGNKFRVIELDSFLDLLLAPNQT